MKPENEGGCGGGVVKWGGSHLNEPGAQSDAMCEEWRITPLDAVVQAAAAAPATDGEASPPSFPPSFLVQNKDNVNAQFYKAKSLLTMWDFLEYKGRIGTTIIALNHKEDPSLMRLMPATCRCRYFDDGRRHISSKINKRLGKFNKVPGLMMTLTYDPKKTTKQDAWAKFGKDTRKFLNSVNQYRKRRGWRRLHYLWVVEVQEDTGYPHVHIFFPNLKWLAPLSILNGNWSEGRANVSSPKKLTTNCAAYISKYLRKMNGWTDLHLAMLWSGRNRMYGFSRGFSPKEEKPESEWNRWHIINTNKPEELEQSLEAGGFTITKDTGKRKLV
ncbi:hypothetical protein ABFB09_05195 [Dehalogenimonas sp. THU2]|uniref:rolling circle replication-associated protein n=1 Tax=Dehalogenimonas sp. THU2 TaxID=3151121 RepID=UPI0032183145